MNKTIAKEIDAPVPLPKEGESWVRTLRADVQVSDLVADLNKEELVIDREVQRGVVWNKPSKQTALIESLLKGIPIGVILTYKRPDGKREVLDGWNRLKTLQNTLNDELRFSRSKLQFLNKKSFSELPENWKDAIKNREVLVLTLLPSNDDIDEARRNAFIKTQDIVGLTIGEKIRVLTGDAHDAVENIRQTNFFKDPVMRVNDNRHADVALAAQLLYIEAKGGVKIPFFNALKSFYEEVGSGKSDKVNAWKNEVNRNLELMHRDMGISAAASVISNSQHLLGLYQLTKQVYKGNPRGDYKLGGFVDYFFIYAKKAFETGEATEAAKSYGVYKASKPSQLAARYTAIESAYRTWRKGTNHFFKKVR